MSDLAKPPKVRNRDLWLQCPDCQDTVSVLRLKARRGRRVQYACAVCGYTGIRRAFGSSGGFGSF